MGEKARHNQLLRHQFLISVEYVIAYGVLMMIIKQHEAVVMDVQQREANRLIS